MQTSENKPKNFDNIIEKRKKLLDVYPNSNKDDYDKYEEQLNLVFSNEEINTTAIVGGYGAGKSTLIKTLEKNKKLKFCYISALPYSSNVKQKNHIEDDESKLDSDCNSGIALEKKIIEQIYNQVSNRSNQRLDYFLYPLFSLCTLGIAIVYFLGPRIENIKSFWSTLRNAITIKAIPILPESTVILFTFSVLWILYSIYVLISTSNFSSIINRVKIPSIEVQLSQHDVGFDRVTTELIRLLSKSNFDAVIVEDLDRFMDKGVIFQLREFANLYNRSAMRKMKFIFLLDFSTIDDEKLRAKFFDHSINVVPYMSYSYSYSYVKEIQKLCEDLGNYSLTHVSDGLIRILTNCIHESRLLRIIISDYIFLSESYYGDKISKLGLEDQERTKIEDLLLSLSIYKHIFTQDYNSFLEGNGNLHSLLIKNENEQTAKLKTSNESYEKNIDSAKKDILNDEKEILLVETFKISEPNYFNDSELSSSYGYIYNRHFKDAMQSQSYKTRIKFLNSNYEKYIADLEEKINSNMMKISYYVPEGDNELKIEWSENTNYNEVIGELLFKGYLTSKVSIYISHRSDDLTPEETFLVEQAISNDTSIDPSIKVNEENIPTIMSLINNEKFETSKLFNYNMMNFFRERKQYISQYKQMVINLEDQIKRKKPQMAIEFFSYGYYGMAKYSNDIYKIMLQDCEYYSEEFISVMFNNFDSKEMGFANTSYYLFLALLATKSLDDILKIDSFVSFVNNMFEIKSLDSLIDRTINFGQEINEIERKFMLLVASDKIRIKFERYFIDNPSVLFKKSLTQYKETLKQKIEKHQFKNSHRLMQLMFFYPDSEDALYLNLKLDKENERKMIDFMLENPIETRDSLIVGPRPIDTDKSIRFWINNKSLNEYDFEERLINNLGLKESLVIFDSIENYSTERVPLQYKDMFRRDANSEFIHWFDDLSKLNEEVVEEVITRNLFKINQPNIDYIVNLFLDSEPNKPMLEFLSTYDYNECVSNILECKNSRTFFTKLFVNISDKSDVESLERLVSKLPLRIIELVEFTMKETISDTDCENILIEKGFLYPSFDLLRKIISEGNNNALDRYKKYIIDVIDDHKELIDKLFSNEEVKSPKTILEIMKETNQFKRDIFKKFEKTREFTVISTNAYSKSFRKPVTNKVNCDLELLKEEKLVKVSEENDSIITFKINWQK